MQRVLLHHSFVATGRVGGRLTAAAIEHCGIDVSFSSTVTLSRHPGLGPPDGGSRRAEALLSDARHAAPIDALAIGYAGSKAMFETLTDHAQAASAPVFVDPILGRRPRGLYVPPDAVPAARALVKHADVVCPNLFELEALTGLAVESPSEIVAAARTLRGAGELTVVAKHVDRDGDAAALYVVGANDTRVETPLAPGRWRGTGDLFFGLLVGGALSRAARPDFKSIAAAATDAAQFIADALKDFSGDGDAPLDAIQDAMDSARQRHRKMGIAPSPCGSAATDQPASDSAARSPARSKSLK